MVYSARVLADSISPLGHRLTTLEVTFPRLVLAEFNTHRVFSRNSASSRAIPVKKQLQRLLTDPFVPERFGINQPGMQSFSFLEGLRHDEARRIWLKGRDRAMSTAIELLLGEELFAKVSHGRDVPGYFDEAMWLLDPKYDGIELDDTKLLNVHKQIANRVLEPYMWHTVIVTATQWGNFFALRVDENAQPEIYRIAEMMLGVYNESSRMLLDYGHWHLPLIQPEEVAEFGRRDVRLRAVSTGRCARVSYLTHEGKRDLEKDVQLHNNLRTNGHMSPLEHPARPMTPDEFRNNPWSGNFYGWHQYRKDTPNENDFSKTKATLQQST